MTTNTPAAPGPLPAGPPHRPAGPGAARDQVRRLRQDGGTYRAIAAAAGLAPATVHDLATGRRTAHPGTTTAVLAVTSATVPARPRRRRRHPAAAARPARHGPRLGPHRPRPRRPRDDHPPARPRRRPHRQPQLRDKVTDLYDAWWDKRAPDRTRAERAAATAARRRAIAGNWCAAAALDDDQLDIPGYRPRQRLETRHRHRHRPRHPPARPPPPEGPPMTSDHRVTPGLIHDIVDALERHGYYRSDDLHADRAVGLIGDLAGIYEGTQDHPASPRTRPPTTRSP